MSNPLDTELLQLITAPDKIKKVEESLSWAIRCQERPRGNVAITLFKLSNWVAVPVSSELLLSQTRQECLQQTLQDYGYHELYAVMLGSQGLLNYLAPVTIEGLDEFRRAMGAFESVLFAGEETPEFIILSIESEVYVVAGPNELVHQLLGYSPEIALSKFQNLVLYKSMPRQVRRYLEQLYARLCSYKSAEVGVEFRIT